jgi:HEAT repeat protein
LSTSTEPGIASQAKAMLSKLDNPPPSVFGLVHRRNQGRVMQEFYLDLLSKQGPGAAQAIPEILTELRSESILIRFMACWTLMHVGPAGRSALPQLRAALSDRTSLVRDAAAEAIRLIEAAP